MSARLSPLFSWRGEIADSDLPPTARHVALTLSLHMSERGDSCFPAVDTLSRETGLHYDTVRAQLRRLADIGWLTKKVIRRGEGRGTRVEYTATIPRKHRISTGAEDTGAPSDVHRGGEPDRTVAENPGVEDVKEDVSEDVPPNPPKSGGGKQRSRRGPPELLSPLERSDDFEQWWQAWTKKVGRLDAVRAWRDMLGHLPSIEQLIGASLEIHERTRREKQREVAEWQQFIPHPATWLRRGDYLDFDVETAAPTEARHPCVLCGVAEPCVERCQGVETGAIEDVAVECVWR